MSLFWYEESLQLGLHGIILGLLIDLLDLVAAPSCGQPLMCQQSIDLLLHSILLFFREVSTSILGGKSGLRGGLPCSLLCKLPLTCAWPNVSWQFKPGEILGPSVDVELKFESHIGR